MLFQVSADDCNVATSSVIATIILAKISIKQCCLFLHNVFKPNLPKLQDVSTNIGEIVVDLLYVTYVLF